MGDDILVKVEGISKKFCRNLRRSLWYGMQELAGELAGRRIRRGTLRPDEFWVLQDVSFVVRQGEMLGLIGQNGAGKSTLLKMLNGLIKPDGGRITMRGNVQALIELGAGFNPILTGRENVYINASVLGIPKAQVDRALPHIIEFAGIEEFMDTPLQSFSSGMKARLGFAVVTQLDPDVLLIDEVLAVGDTAFQEKCMRRMNALRQSDKAIIFVTHSLYQVEALCNKALWLEKGRIVQYGNAGDVVRAYLDDQERRAMAESQREGVTYQGRATVATKAYFQTRDEEKTQAAMPKKPAKSELLEIRRVELVDADGNIGTEFPFQSDLTVRIHYNAVQPVSRPLFNLRFFHQGADIFETSMLIDGYGPDQVEGEGTVECRIPKLPLTPKVYNIVLFVRSAEGIADVTTMRTVAQFRITNEHLTRVPLRGPMAVNHLRQGSPVYVTRSWHFYNGHDSKPVATIEAGYVHES
jgi:ABC-type polysaccharide/polyol phosphate transport system ATPase subunit